MATYEITTPDGQKFQITAPDGATEQEVMEFARQQAEPAADQAPQPEQRGPAYETIEQRHAQALTQGEGVSFEDLNRASMQALFSFGDEINAGLSAVNNRFFGDGEPIKEGYEHYVNQERDKLEQFRERNPWLAYGTEFASAIPVAIATAPLAAGRAAVAVGSKVAPWLANAGRAAKTGAVQGTAYGVGVGQDSLSNRLRSGFVGGVVGGGAGLGMTAAAQPASRLVRYLLGKSPTQKTATSLEIHPKLSAMLQRTLDSDEALTNAGLKRLLAAGDDAMLADVSPNASGLLDTIIQSGGPPASLARNAIEARVTRASGSVTSTLDDILGAPQGRNATARGIAQGTSAARREAYELAYSLPIDYASNAGRNIEAVLGRIPPGTMKKAIEIANNRMIAGGRSNRQIKINLNDDGTFVVEELPNVIQLDYIKRALGEMGAEGVDQFGRKTADGSMYAGLARNLREAVSEAVPEYSQAVRLGGDKIERDVALRMGHDLMRPNVTREMAADTFEGMSDAARDAAKRGLRIQIDDAMANVKMAMTDGNMDAREAFNLLKSMSSRANRDKIAILLGDDAAPLFRGLDQAVTAFELRAAVATNSKTFARQSSTQAIDEVLNAGPWNAFLRGEIPSTIKGIGQNFMGRSEAAKRATADELNLDLAKLLTQPDPIAAFRTLRTAPRIGAAADTKLGETVSKYAGRNAPFSQNEGINPYAGPLPPGMIARILAEQQNRNRPR